MRGRIRKILTVVATLAPSCLLAACGGAVLPTSPTPVSSTLTTSALQRQLSPNMAVVDGLVQHDHGIDSWALGGVLVEALEAGVVTMSTISDDNGYFHFELAPGEIRLRGSKRGYLAATTSSIKIQAGERTITRFRMQQPYVPPAPLPPIPYTEWPLRTISGRVTDVFGNAVASVSVCAMETGAGFALGCTGTDASGGYTMSFRVASAERRPATLDVSRSGYPKQQLPLECCASPEPMVVNITMPMLRVVKVELLGPTALRVMVPVQLMALVTFEDGSAVTMKPILLDVRGTIQNSRQGSGMIEGFREGGGPAWWSYQGVTGGLVFTVTP
jgi:hypothetical protein